MHLKILGAISRIKPSERPIIASLALMALLILSGCSAAHYHRAADKQVYGIVQTVENSIFGRTNAFSIDTAFSSRKPEEIAPSELIDGRLQTNRRVLSIEAAVDLAVKNSREYQSQKERLYLTALTLTGQRYQFSPQFLASSTASIDRSSDGEVSGSINNRVSVSQLLKTGGRLGMNLANDLLRYYTGDPRRSVVSAISVNLAQPLLRGFGRNNSAVESLTQAERNVVYAVREFNYFQHQFALGIVNDYIRLLAQKDTIRNRYTNYLGQMQSTRRLEARLKDREQLVQVDEARQQELSAKNNYVNAIANYFNSLDQFKITLGLPLGEKIYLDDEALKVVQTTGLVPVALDPVAAYSLAVKKQMQLLNAIDTFEDLKRKVRVAADQLKPQLDLTADASLDAEPYPDYTEFDLNKIRAGAGLSLDLPIDRLRERNTYRAALVSFEAGLRTFTLTLDNLRNNIQRGLRTLEQRRENFEIQRNALDLANRRVRSATLMLEAGRVEVRYLLDAQESQLSSINNVTAALVDYQETRLQLMLDIGALDTNVPQFWLKDHLANVLPTQPAAVIPEVSTGKDVIPPETFFNN